jgi:hypothetical protein
MLYRYRGIPMPQSTIFLIHHLPWAMLLHSGHADHACNRFDILVADPLSTLVTGVNRPPSPMRMARASPQRIRLAW